MDNTVENKSKVFALYWGQHVVKNTNWHFTEKVNPITVISVLDSSHYLEVKPISSISDEDASVVANILKYKEDNYFIKNFGCRGFEHVKDEILNAKEGFIGHIVNQSSRVLEVADYLRSKGYALPAYGLSVNELVNRGWIILEGDSQ